MTPTRALIEAAEKFIASTEVIDFYPECRAEVLSAISSAKAAEEGVESGTKVFLIRGMQKKPTFVSETRTAHCIDGRWYWSDGTAVDGSAMRGKAKEKAPEGT